MWVVLESPSREPGYPLSSETNSLTAYFSEASAKRKAHNMCKYAHKKKGWIWKVIALDQYLEDPVGSWDRA